MAISDKITSITNHLIDDYEALENLGADLTNVDKNIENIKSVAEQIYDNLPKTSCQEGAEVNLGKTLKGKLDYENGVVGIGQSSQDGTPTPSTPITINSVTGNQDVVVSGKNLVEGIEYGDINPQDGAMYGSDSAIRSKNYITYDTSKTYYVSVNNVMPTTLGLNLRFFNKSKEYIGYSTLTGSGSNFAITKGNQVTTTDLEPKYFKFRQTLSAGPITSLNDNVMIATISGATYEPYITPTSYQLSLGDIELNAIGNYKDELIYDVENDKVYKNEKIGKKIFTGASDENWGYWNGIIFIDYTNIKNLGGNNTNFFLNYLQHINSIAYIGDSTGYRLHINLSNAGLSNITSASAWKTWLSTHNLEFVYVCNETQTEITDTTLKAQVKALYNAHSLNGTTIITSNGNLPMIIKVRGLKGE